MLPRDVRSATHACAKRLEARLAEDPTAPQDLLRCEPPWLKDDILAFEEPRHLTKRLHSEHSVADA